MWVTPDPADSAAVTIPGYAPGSTPSGKHVSGKETQTAVFTSLQLITAACPNKQQPTAMIMFKYKTTVSAFI